MSPMWRVSSITFAVSLISIGLGEYLDSQTATGAGANIGAGFLVMLGWGIAVLGVVILVHAVVGDLARDRPGRDRYDESE
ncbi:hypothetical protein ACU61A_20665 [Pseudonocardia sichuanensis]